MFYCIYSALYYIALLFGLYFLHIKSNPQPIAGVYAQPTKWAVVKFYLIKLVIFLRRKKAERSSSKDQSSGYGQKSNSSVDDMEKVQVLPVDQPKAVDAVYFNGSNSEGVYFVTAIARRQQNMAQTVFMICHPKLGLFQLPVHPETNQTGVEDLFGTTDGLEVKCMIPMKKWQIRYKGNLRNSDGNLVRANLNFTWQACSATFDFDTDMSLNATCRAIAREPWSRDLFARLKEAHQTHYEQFGDLTGTFEVEGEKVDLRLRGARDHSYGKIRDWNDFHRYAMHFIHLDDGRLIQVGVISMPNVTMSRLEIGYMLKPDGSKTALNTCDLQLHLLGETKQPPPNYFTFNMTFDNTEECRVECEVLHNPHFYIGLNRGAKIYEQMCRFKVDGVKGYGFAEWQYRNLGE